MSAQRATPASAFMPCRAAGRSRIAWLVLALAAAAAFVVWAEHRGSAPPPPLTNPTVLGRVVIEGGKDPSPGRSDIHPIPSARLVVIGVTATGDRLVKHLRADVHGRFALRLPPGRYTVTAPIFEPARRPLSDEPRARVTVTGGRPVRIQLKGYTI